jgi:hypothetical protein
MLNKLSSRGSEFTNSTFWLKFELRVWQSLCSLFKYSTYVVKMMNVNLRATTLTLFGCPATFTAFFTEPDPITNAARKHFLIFCCQVQHIWKNIKENIFRSSLGFIRFQKLSLFERTLNRVLGPHFVDWSGLLHQLSSPLKQLLPIQILEHNFLSINGQLAIQNHSDITKYRSLYVATQICLSTHFDGTV